MRFLSLLTLAVIALASALPANAEPSTIVLIEEANPSELSRETTVRTRGELEAAGFSVVRVTPPEGADTRGALESAVSNAGAVAAIAQKSDPQASAVEVWVSDRLTSKLSIRRVATGGSHDTPELVAIRTVELLRASLIELRDPPQTAPPAPPLKLPPAVAHLTAPRPAPNSPGWQGLGIEVGIAGLLHVDPPNPGVAPMVRLSYGSKLGVGARLTWIGPSLGPGLPGSLGRALLTEELADLELVVSPALPQPMELLFFAGTGVNHVAASGDLQNSKLALSGSKTAFAFSIGLAGAARVAPHVAIDLDLFSAFTAPRIVVDMGKDRVGTVGRPTLGATTGVRASF